MTPKGIKGGFFKKKLNKTFDRKRLKCKDSLHKNQTNFENHWRHQRFLVYLLDFVTSMGNLCFIDCARFIRLGMQKCLHKING